MLNDIATERALLACLCQFKDFHIDVAPLLSEALFTDNLNKILFKSVLYTAQNNPKVDIAGILSSANELNLAAYLNTDIASKYLKSLFDFPVSSENGLNYAKKLKKLEISRFAQSQHKLAYDELANVTGRESINDILGISEKPFWSITKELQSNEDDEPKLLWDGAEEYLKEKFDNPVDMVGIPTPWPRYNTAIGGGIRRGGVSLVGARPKVGKTTLAKECAFYVSNKLKIPVLMLDTEMGKTDQLNRTLSSISKIKTNRIETGKAGTNDTERNKVFETLNKIKDSRYFYKRISGMEFESVLSVIRRWIVKEVGFDDKGKIKDCLVIYDYFKLMTANPLKDMQEYQAMGFQISAMSDFAKEYDFPCLAFVQLNRDGEEEDSGRVISQSDRLLWLCHSFSIYRYKSVEEKSIDGEENGNMKLIPCESRFGPCLEEGDYISMFMQGDIALIKEGLTRNEIKNGKRLEENEEYKY